MRYCTFLIVLFILLGVENVAAQKVWLETSIKNEKIISVTSYQGILLVGTERGAYRGVKYHLDGAPEGYPNYEWEMTPLRSIYTSAEHEQFLKGTSTMAVLDGGTIYALSDSGLFYIPTTLWNIGIPEEQVWKEDKTFDGKMTKLSGHGETIFLTVGGKLYKKTKDSDWEHIQFYTDWDKVSGEMIRGPEHLITDYKVCGRDIVVTIESLFDGPGFASDIYVTSDTGKSWIAGPNYVLNLVDFTAYRSFWNDEFVDIAYCYNDTYNDSTKVSFFPDAGLVSLEGIDGKKVVTKAFQGVAKSLERSLTTKADIPYFYLNLSTGVYHGGDAFELKRDEAAPENLEGVYVGPEEMTEVVGFSENALYYNTFFHGVSVLGTATQSREKRSVKVIDDRVELFNTATGQFKLLSLQGRVIDQGRITQGVNTISLSNMAKGTYILRLDIAGAVQTEKIRIK